MIPFALLDVDYLFAFAPLAFGHLIIPPISRVRGFFQRRELNEAGEQIFQAIYDYFTPKELWSMKNLKALMLDPDNMEGERMVTLLTHMFVHGDYHHLLGNLSTLFFCGHRVQQAFNTIGLYGIFFLSGMACQVPSPIRVKQDLQKPLPMRVLHIVIPPLSCGSSGGVCGVLGANVVLAICDGLSALQRNAKDKTTTPSGRTLRLVKTALSFWGPCVTLLTMYREWRDVGTAGFGIDNAAHIQGFAVGVVLALLGQSLQLATSGLLTGGTSATK